MTAATLLESFNKPSPEEIRGFITCAMHSGRRDVNHAANHAVIERFVDQYPNSVDVQGYNGATALMMAAVDGCLDTVELLLKKGAAVDMTDDFGKTALQYAKSGGHWEIARALEHLQLLKQEEDRHAQWLKDTEFSRGLKKSIPAPRTLKLPPGKA
jgi:hypothetical protein